MTCILCSQNQILFWKDPNVLLGSFSSCHSVHVTHSCPTLCHPMDCSTPGLPVYHQPPELAQTYLHWVGGDIQPSHPLSSPSPPAFSLSQHQGLFKWVCSSHQVAKLLKLQLQHQSTQWMFRTDPRDSQESSPTPQFFSATLTSIHDYWKNHSFD